ncbi:MAG: histidine kinase [Bryobacteraceae bacterium]
MSKADDPLRRAGKTLHDDVAPLLIGAGLQLQLLRMDHPETAARVTEILATLDDAMERVRALSQQLAPSPFTPGGA